MIGSSGKPRLVCIVNRPVISRQYAIARYMLSHVRLSVRPSVTRVDQSKTVEDRIMQLSPQSSPMTLVSSWLTPLVISIFV